MAADLPQNARNALPRQTTPISARDSVTGADVPNVGDTANAAIRVNVVAGGAGGLSNVNLQQVGGTATSVNNGTSDAGTLRVTLASNSTGQVAVASVVPGTGATNLGKAEGAAATASDVGVPALVYNDADAKYRWFPVYDSEIPNTLKRGPMLMGWSPLDVVPAPLAIDVVDGAGRLILSQLSQVTAIASGTPLDGAWPGTAGAFPGGFETQDSTSIALNTATKVGAGRVTTQGDQWMRLPAMLALSTFTATGNGTTTGNVSRPMRNFAIQVTATGAVTSWDVRLEISLDGTTFTTILTHTNVDGTGVVKVLATPAACFFWRLRCAGIVLGAGTNVVAYGCGVQ